MRKEPQPLKAVLVSAPTNPLGTLYYIWKQSRHNREIPTPAQIEEILVLATKDQQDVSLILEVKPSILDNCNALGYDNLIDCARHIRDELYMIMNEGIPVIENLFFVFHLQNIPISLREQLVRHRIGTKLDGRVGVDIIPEPLSAVMTDAPKGALMHMGVVPDLADSTWWSQTSRVIPYTEFFDEGRYILPATLKGKTVTVSDSHATMVGGESEFRKRQVDAEKVYLDHMRTTQEVYKTLVEAGVHIEDARQLIPVGATHHITWGLNLKAMMHIFGKRSSWIAQIGIWEGVIMQMLEELVTKVHPMFRMMAMPQCIKKGKYVGCPVSGTNAERVAGVDGMPPCPLWVRYETDKAVEAYKGAYEGKFPGITVPSWTPPINDDHHGANMIKAPDVRLWSADFEVEREMLERTGAIYSKVWGFGVFDGIPEEEA